MEGSYLPPCSRVLFQKVKQANFVTGKWISAVDCSPPPFTPEPSGWVLVNEMYTIKWFDSAISPESIEVICCNENNVNDDDDNNNNNKKK